MRLGTYFGNLLAAVTGSSPRPNFFDERYWATGLASMGKGRAGGVVTYETVVGLDSVEGVLVALSGPLSTLPIGIFEKADPDDVDNVPAVGAVGGDNDDDLTPLVDPTKPNVSAVPMPPDIAPGHKRKLDDHPLARIFNGSANNRDTAQEYRTAIIRDLAIWRNCYSVIEQDVSTGEIESLTRLDPRNKVKVYRTPAGRVAYDFRDIDSGKVATYTQDQIWHVRLAPHDLTGLCGDALFVTARDVFSRAIAVKHYGDDFFRNSGSSGMYITHPGVWKSQEDKDKFLESWKSDGVWKDRHGDRIMPPGMDVKKLAPNNNEAQFIETDNQAGLAVCRLFNMPPHRVGMLDRATNNNIEQQALEFVQYTLAPYVEAIEQAIERDLLVGEEKTTLCVEMNLNALLRGDLKTRMLAYAQGRQWGWLSVNMIHRMENWPGIGPQGDRFLEPVNMKGAGDGGTKTSSGDPLTDGAPDFTGDPADDPNADPQDPADDKTDKSARVVPIKRK